MVNERPYGTFFEIVKKALDASYPGNVQRDHPAARLDGS